MLQGDLGMAVIVEFTEVNVEKEGDFHRFRAGSIMNTQKRIYWLILTVEVMKEQR